MSKYPKSKLFEKLADIEHQRWASWQHYCHATLRKELHGVLDPKADEALERILARWDKQIATSYKQLSEEDKDKDREQVMRYWHLVRPPKEKFPKF